MVKKKYIAQAIFFVEIERGNTTVKNLGAQVLLSLVTENNVTLTNGLIGALVTLYKCKNPWLPWHPKKCEYE